MTRSTSQRQPPADRGNRPPGQHHPPHLGPLRPAPVRDRRAGWDNTPHGRRDRYFQGHCQTRWHSGPFFLQRTETAHARPISGCSEWRREYDDRGNCVQSTDPAGNSTSYVYDACGALRKIIDALGGTTQIENSAAGLPLLVKDHRGPLRGMYGIPSVDQYP